MFIYNITINVNWNIHDHWKQWMKEEHMPEVIHTGCFTGSQLVRVLETEEQDGPTYAAQYYAESRADYNRYIELYADELRKKSIDRWGNGFIAFRSLMQVVQ